MSGQSSVKPGGTSSTSLASPEAMLGLWTSWVDAASRLASAGGPVPWYLSPDQVTGDLLRGGIQQLSGMLAKDPILHAMETALNANPLRDVVPVDWAEITRALRAVCCIRSSSRTVRSRRASRSTFGSGSQQWKSGMRRAGGGWD